MKLLRAEVRLYNLRIETYRLNWDEGRLSEIVGHLIFAIPRRWP